MTPAIAVHSNGNAIVAWGSVRNRSSEVCVREWDGEKWGEIQTLTDEDNFPDMVPAVSFDQKGHAVVVWAGMDTNYVPRLATAWKQDNGKWHIHRLHLKPKQIV